MRYPTNRLTHRAATLGLVLVMAGCASTGGGCSPIDNATPPSDSVTTTTADPDGSTTTTVPGDGAMPIAVLEVADCFSPADDDAFVDEVNLIDCDTPHVMEVFAQYELDETEEYPGGTELTWAAQDECQERFEDYVGASYWTSKYDITTLTPSFSTWDTGDRTVTCLIVKPDGSKLTARAKDSAL